MRAPASVGGDSVVARSLNRRNACKWKCRNQHRTCQAYQLDLSKARGSHLVAFLGTSMVLPPYAALKRLVLL